MHASLCCDTNLKFPHKYVKKSMHFYQSKKHILIVGKTIQIYVAMPFYHFILPVSTNWHEMPPYNVNNYYYNTN